MYENIQRKEEKAKDTSERWGEEENTGRKTEPVFSDQIKNVKGVAE